jgi:hypothetical protein
MLAELSLAHAVRADVEQRRAGFPAGAEPVNSEARENDAFPCHKHGDKLCRRDIRIEFEIEARPAVKLAGDIRPFPDRAEAIAHANKISPAWPESSAASRASINADGTKSGAKLDGRVRLAHEGDGFHLLEKAVEAIFPLTARNNNGQQRIDGTDFPNQRIALRSGNPMSTMTASTLPGMSLDLQVRVEESKEFPISNGRNEPVSDRRTPRGTSEALQTDWLAGAEDASNPCIPNSLAAAAGFEPLHLSIGMH